MSVLRKVEAPHHAFSRTSETDDFEMEDSSVISARSDDGETIGQEPVSTAKSGRLAGVARHTLGLILLLLVVLLWTASNFLSSSIFADSSYAKPFFLTYLNTSMFVFCILPRLVRSAYRKRKEGLLADTVRNTFTVRTLRVFWTGKDEKEYIAIDEEEDFLKPNDNSTRTSPLDSHGILGLIPTARLSLTFCLLWFSANYFAVACLQYTTVASTTILTSTSSVWTLLIGALTRTEKFTWRKLCGVLGSLAGVVLISQIDLQARDEGSDNSRRGLDEFPDKSPYELALGDALALLSAIIYGLYTITLKKTTMIAMPKSIHMPTFFGFVGLFNIFLLFPVFPILHFSGLELFTPPPTLHIWMILIVNSVSSLLSDICWAYAMVFTSPLVVTVGLSLTIPLSLVGEMIIQNRSESWIYWLGAFIVVGSFVFVEREEKSSEENGERQTMGDEEDFGEPGPAIVVEDYDELMIRREQSQSPLLVTAEDEEGRR